MQRVSGVRRARQLLTALALLLSVSRPTTAHIQAQATPPPVGYTDPFAYCATVGTVDQPDDRWSGPPVPEAVIEGLIRAAGLSPDIPREQLSRSTFWRCMGGKVYACTVGANLPCQSKADTRRAPSRAMWLYCDQNPDADVIPAYVTGRETVYQWRCSGTRPVVVRRVTEPDARGFLKHIWYRISPE